MCITDSPYEITNFLVLFGLFCLSAQKSWSQFLSLPVPRADISAQVMPSSDGHMQIYLCIIHIKHMSSLKSYKILDNGAIFEIQKAMEKRRMKILKIVIDKPGKWH